MISSLSLRKSVLLCRLILWLAALATAWFAFRTVHPVAWQAAAFGTLFALLWPLVQPSSDTSDSDMVTEDGDDAEESDPETEQKTRHKIQIGADLIALTLLVTLSGGYASLFAPLLVFLPLEAALLLGGPAGLITSLAVAVASLAHLRPVAVPLNSGILYALSVAIPLMATLFLALPRQAPLENENENESTEEELTPSFGLFSRRPSPGQKSKEILRLERFLADADEAQNRLKASYREVAQLSREQQIQLERLHTAERLFEVSCVVPVREADASSVHSSLLRVVMEALDSGGGALWLRAEGRDRLELQAAEGRIAKTLQSSPILHTSEYTPASLRELCEKRLFAALPVSATVGGGFPARTTSISDTNSEGSSQQNDSGEVIVPHRGLTQPFAVVLLRESSGDREEIGKLIGAIGLCEPRGTNRFSTTDFERLHGLIGPLIAALANVAERQAAQQQNRELSLLYDLSRLVQSAGDIGQVHRVVIAHAHQMVPFENGTLFVFDVTQTGLEVRATIGRDINLLDHIEFPRGRGLSGWVADQGRQLHLPDLSRETNLLNAERIPPRIRSFACIPIRTQERVVGVLTISHSQPEAFTAEDLERLTLLAGQAAVTLERADVIRTLEVEAITDGLTEAYNYRYFTRRLEEELRRTRRYGVPLTLCLLDLDGFKAINDRYGHVNGDKMLRELTELLRSSVRETEIIARYGGEEFAVILPQTTLEQAAVAAERIRRKVEQNVFKTLDGQTIHLTVSLGLAASPEHASEAKQLVEETDRALYAAKRAGRNQVSLASPPVLAVTGQTTPAEAKVTVTDTSPLQTA